MTTVTLQGLAFVSGLPQEVVSTTITIALDDRYTAPSYSLLPPSDPDYDPEAFYFTFDNEPATVSLDDFPIFGDRDVTGEFVRVEWTDENDVSRVTDVLFVDDLDNDVPRIFKLAGDDLPTFASAAEFDAFGGELDAVGPITTGQFRPNFPIDLTLSDGFLWVSDDDGIADFDSINDFVLGDGDDYFFGLDGNDVVDMGESPDDFDVFSYFGEEQFLIEFESTTPTSGFAATLSSGTWTITDLYGDTDSVTGVERFDGTSQIDSMTGDGSIDYIRVRGFAGDDIFHGHANTYDSVEYRYDAVEGGFAGINADLAAGEITDGFGDIDTVSSIDEIRGTASSDTMRFSPIGLRMRGEGGDDHLYSGIGNDRFEGGDGSDMAHYNDATSGVNVNLIKAVGTGHGRDTYDSIEIVVGSNFDDVIVGDATATLLNGRNGNDILRSTGTATELRGGNGDDKLFGDVGDEVFDGGADNDIIKSGQGNDAVSGGAGLDVVRAGQGNDSVSGGDDNDRLFGNGGDDVMSGDDGDDLLDGGGNSDTLLGGAGDDALKGGGGRDTLNGGEGDDNLFGGTSVDTFVFSATNNGADRIKDWEDAKDLLDLTDFGFADFAAVEAIASNAGSLNMKLDFGGGNQVVIENFRLADFDDTDVLIF